MKIYNKMSEDEKFDWALDEYNLCTYQIDQVMAGEMSQDILNQCIYNRRIKVQLTAQQTKKIFYDMHIAQSVVNKFLVSLRQK